MITILGWQIQRKTQGYIHFLQESRQFTRNIEPWCLCIRVWILKMKCLGFEDVLMFLLVVLLRVLVKSKIRAVFKKLLTWEMGIRIWKSNINFCSSMWYSLLCDNTRQEEENQNHILCKTINVSWSYHSKLKVPWQLFCTNLFNVGLPRY